MDKAAQTLADWDRQMRVADARPMSAVNLSAIQVARDDIAEVVASRAAVERARAATG